ncbi:MAG: hypothetical protein WD069_01470 [Planctomycetales bacterium]
MEAVYLETTFISYLVALPARDLIVAAHQQITRDAETLTEAIMDSGAFPDKAVRDAAHIAVAAVHGIQYLLTWNCKHLANAQISKRVRKVCDERGYDTPLICTPEELLEETTDEG